jgi:hypothetical protein
VFPLVNGGGAKRARTADPLLAKQVLFQLSYSPRSPPPAALHTSLTDGLAETRADEPQVRVAYAQVRRRKTACLRATPPPG